VLLVFVVGCNGNSQIEKVYQVTCWNGGTVIYDEVLVQSWGFGNVMSMRTLDGKPAYPPYGDVACKNTLIRNQKKETR
jgi:hypothetical protein